MGIKCPKCQSDNPSDSKLCKDCGAQLHQRKKTPVSETKTIRSPIKDVNIGEIIAGKYKLMEELGKGGMGIVYKAEQIKPVKRSVALKVIKLGMDTGQVVARFETERQALAVMNHPNIAKVFDAGATERGRPYFVMELVQGIPIAQYCDKHKLRTRERLELFMPVCQAVQHAHQKGVIHRDLKPSNVIVSVQEDKPMPKIIDFGIAKATAHRLTERTLFTEQGQLVGTPEYMSPEQAEMSGLDVDTRTDIYSLGVMLYELLVGVLPFDPKTIREAGFSEIQRIIRETEPQKASTRFSKLGDTQTSIAEYRRTDPLSLQRQLKGDLDWITMKAMSKDRTQRYASASELASDIMRHLKHDPILASPPSTIYRIRKYVRRHKTGVVAAALVVLAMFIGITGTSIGLVKARLAEKKAKTEAETSRQVSDFLVDLFKVSDPSEAKGNTITAREILDQGANKIATSLQEQPPIQASLMDTIGKVYMNLGLYKQSAPLLEKALELREEVFGESHIEVAESLYNLSELYTEEAKYEEAENLGKRSLDTRERILGPEHPDTAESLTNLGEIYRQMGKFEEAESFFRRSLAIREKALGPEHTDVAASLNSLANVAADQAEFNQAETLYKRALKIWEKSLGEDDLKVADCLNNLALLYETQEKFAEAEPLYKRCLSIKEKIYGPEHPNVAVTLNNLGILCSDQGRFTEAESFYKRCINIRKKTLGQDHPEFARALSNLAILYCQQGKFEESIPLFKRVLEIREKALGHDHPDIASSLNNLAATYGNLKMYDKIEPLFKRALSIREKAYGPNHYLVGQSLQNLGNICFDLGKLEEAEPLILRSLKIIENNFGPEHSSNFSSLNTLAHIYREWKKYDKAEHFYKRAISIAERSQPPTWLANVLEDYAILLRKTNRTEEAKKIEAKVKAIRSK